MKVANILKISINRYRRTIIFIVIGIILSIILYSALNTNKHPMNISKVVETEIIQNGRLRRMEKFIGTIRSKNYCVLIAKSNGTIDTLYHAGSSMKKGDIIAKIDNPDIEKNYDLCLNAEKLARLQYERIKKLEKSGASSRGNLEEKEKAWIDAQRMLSLSKIELDNIMIKAPFNGILGVYKIKDGEQIRVGDQIVSFYDPNNMVIDFDIPGEFIDKIKDGQTVIINNSIESNITHIQKAIDEEKHMCPAYIDIKNNNKNDGLIIGDNVYLDVVIEQKNNAINVSKNAVFIRNDKNFVYVVKNNVLELRNVEIGITENERVEITKGLLKNEEVVSISQDRLYDKMTVSIAKNNNKK